MPPTKNANKSKTSKTATSKKEPVHSLTIAAIGASAGGIAALRKMFAAVPADSGVAYVIVMHLSPDYESRLAEVLAINMPIPVKQVTKTTVLKPDHAYVIPPNANLDAIDSHLRLTELESSRAKRAPIDHFFRTAANVHDGNTVAIILSGTGSDGTLGCREVKGAGGMIIVQDPNEANYDGMPRSVIATGLADSILPADKIAEAVMAYARTSPKLSQLEDDETSGRSETEVLSKLFNLLRARTGRDFSGYKRSTISRRLQRRMQMNQIEELGDYIDLMRKQPQELQVLSDDLLITVTSFFRDESVFSALAKDIVPRLFEGKKNADPIRVWSVGCSTGEEAYSLAILLVEECGRQNIKPHIQVFASDLHDQSLRSAREGVYSRDIKAEISATRLKRFFISDKGGYRICKEVREMVIFAPHNVLSDPPFSRVDMIVCRNLLIYIQRKLQGDILDVFHYALSSSGFLILGTSETTESSDLFRSVDKKNCIYQKQNIPAPEPRLPVFPSIPGIRNLQYTPLIPEVSTRENYGALHYQLVEKYAPPSVLVSGHDKIVHSSMHASRYLIYNAGEPSNNLFKIVVEDLRVELHSALEKARSLGKTVCSPSVTLRIQGQEVSVRLRVTAALTSEPRGYALVFFEESQAGDRPTLTGNRGNLSYDRQAELEERVLHVRQRLQNVVEEYETSQEEMRASHEEMQSTNEELRSTLEELETSKEELQSMNEELQTVNQENRHKVEELARLTDDLQNLFSATDIATIFLDRDLRIMRLTAKASDLFNIRNTDYGRSICDFSHSLASDSIYDNAQQVLKNLIPIEREVQDVGGRWYLSRLIPYRSAEDRIDGVVMTFVDISGLKQSQQDVLNAKDYAETIINTIHEPLLVLEPDMRISTANPAVCTLMGLDAAKIVGQLIYHIGSGEWDGKKIHKLFENELDGKEARFEYEVDQTITDSKRYLLFNVQRLDADGRMLVGIRDITRRKLDEARLREADRNKETFLATLSHELRNPLAPLCSGLELLMQSVTDVEQRKTLGLIQRQSQLLVALVNDLLDVSRLSLGKLQIRPEHVNLRELIDAVVDGSVQLFREAGVSLHVNAVADDILLVGDPNRLYQILSNLLHNASKYTPRGGNVEVSVQLSEDKVQTSVKDTGRGLHPHQLESIFSMFMQGEAANGKAPAGLGIGLPLARVLAEMHGGKLLAQSDGIGQGSTFLLELPLAAHAEIAEPTPDTETGEAIDSDIPEGLRVLVADDNNDTTTVMAELVRILGCQVEIANNGKEAVDIADRFEPDVVFMDLGMPEMDGWEAAREMHKQSWSKHTYLVAVTGWGQQQDRLRAQESGFDEHIVKPISIKQLKAILRRYTAKYIET